MSEFSGAICVLKVKTHVHVVPIGDLREHITDFGGGWCWCNPDVNDGVVVHHSMDERETYEEGRKPQ